MATFSVSCLASEQTSSKKALCRHSNGVSSVPTGIETIRSTASAVLYGCPINRCNASYTPISFRRGYEVLLGPVALERVAGPAEELEVVQVVRAASGLGHNVVDGEVAEGEHDLASRAQALLPPEQDVLVLAVVLGGVHVRAAGLVPAGRDVAVVEQARCPGRGACCNRWFTSSMALVTKGLCPPSVGRPCRRRQGPWRSRRRGPAPGMSPSLLDALMMRSRGPAASA